MIKRIIKKHSDEALFSQLQLSNEKTKRIEYDYANVIVKKPWGYEYLVFENEYVSIWMLHISRTQKTSMHSHPKKITSLLLLSGNATLSHLSEEIELKPLDGVVIEKGVFHSTEASSLLSVKPVSQNGIWVMEIESPPEKNDLIRLEDKYGREGKSYEDSDSVVFEPTECLKLNTPEENRIFSTMFLDYIITVRNGVLIDEKYFKGSNTLFVPVGLSSTTKAKKSMLRIGEVLTQKDIFKEDMSADLDNFTILTIELEEKMIKVSDYIFSFIADLGVKDIFAVAGGGAMHLVDSVGKSDRLNYIATHHEQAAAMATEGYARISGGIGVALVTSGPGGTNALTGVCGAWIDSIPTIFISGQVTRNNLIGDTGLRQFGLQESNITTIVRSVTKYAVCVTDPTTIKYHLQKAAYIATSGRPGPVWIDIPLDVQSKIINPDSLPSFKSEEMDQEEIIRYRINLIAKVTECIEMIKHAKRPVLISGYGIRLANGVEQYKSLVNKLGIPVISSWTTSDIIHFDHKLYIGRSGIMGDRAGNFTVQNADLLLIIGSRMSIPQVGYNSKAFAREAKKIMVDIDKVELSKPSISVDLKINFDAKDFILEMLRQLDDKELILDIDEWREKCIKWKNKYPVILQEYKDLKEKVNSFYFIDFLSSKLDETAIVVTDMGTSFTCTMQTFKTKEGQRLFTSSGHASMGFGLPGAIGACFANNRKKIICISGDGGLQMNIQEFQTLAHYKLPIILFVLNNSGYLTIKLMQQNHFGRYVGSDKASGVSFPDIIKVASAYGIKTDRISNNDEMHNKLENVLKETGPFVCEIIIPENQQLIPRVSSLKRPDGTIISKPLEDLFPFLERDEFYENMIVESFEILK